MTSASTALHDLREALKSPIPSVEEFTFLLSSTLNALGLRDGGDSKITYAESSYSSSTSTRQALKRHFGPIQHALLSTAVPTFFHALDKRDREVLESFFCPPSTAPLAALATSIALSTYVTVPPFLTSKTGIPPLSTEARSFVLDMLSKVSTRYGVKEIYQAVWSADGAQGAEQSKAAIERDLQWEEAVRALVSLPAKASNAVGRWNVEGWKGELPCALVAKTYHDNLILNLEQLMFQERLDRQSPERIRQVFERLAATGLLVPKASQNLSHTPSLLPALLPPILKRFDQGHDMGSEGYPAKYLPSIFLSLPTPTLNAFVDALLSHLTLHLDGNPPLEPDLADARIRIALQALTGMLGLSEEGNDAWDGILVSVHSRKSIARPMDPAEHARNRLIVAWIARSGEKALISLSDQILNKWTDAKWIKFTPYAVQFQLTHLLLLAMGRIRAFHPYVVKTSQSGRFLMACQSYLANPDPAVRRLGMLVAETLSELTIALEPEMGEKDDTEELMKGLELGNDAPKAGSDPSGGPRRLRFGGGVWDGDGQGREEARWLRKVLRARDEAAALPPPGSKSWLLGWDLTTSPERDAERDAPISRGRPPSPKAQRSGHHGSATKSSTKPKTKPRPKIVMLDEDDDPMQGYSSSSAASSRSPSPTPSYLEEIANDPTLALEPTDKKKVQRPVYIPQLLALLKDKDNPDAIEMALNYGEALVRAKRSFGTELSENAASLTAYLVGLNDPFNLEDFEDKRDRLTRAVVACAPKQAAPYLAEQYFSNQYSLQQRSVMLTALAMAARELAGLHVPEPALNTRRIDFPSKTLPLALHKQYAGPADQVPRLANRRLNQIDMVSDEIRGILLSAGARRAEEAVPDIARQKRLRVGLVKNQVIAEEGTIASRQMHAAQQQAIQSQIPKPVVPYREVAAEYFILPLINLFWDHYRDAAARQARSIAIGTKYRGAGTGTVLSPMALERFLLTIALLVHAARHSSVYLSIIVPEALDLAITVGSNHLTRPDDHSLVGDNKDADDGSQAEGQVVAAALEVALVCLDGATEVDQGRSLAMDKPELVLAAGEWAQGVFEVESAGGKVAPGQAREGKMKAAAAGVVVKVAEIGDKWSRFGVIGR